MRLVPKPISQPISNFTCKEIPNISGDLMAFFLEGYIGDSEFHIYLSYDPLIYNDWHIHEIETVKTMTIAYAGSTFWQSQTFSGPLVDYIKWCAERDAVKSSARLN